MIFNICTSVFFIVHSISVSCEEDYGETWLYFVDENNNSHVMNFSLPTDNRAFIFGDAYFYLYTRQNIEEPEQMILPKKGNKISSKHFNESNDIRVITHGWMSNYETEWIQGIKNGILNVSECNVVLLDWKSIANNPAYPWPALCTRYVGRQLSKLLAALADAYEIDERHIYLIGHSLGAQIMGYAGMFSNGRVNRITGLDPARPLFEFPDVGNNFRLDASDAAFVDIIHSCAGTLGYKYSHGTADFYPNGGQSPQPGCENAYMAAFHSDACSHGQSYYYFSASIRGVQFEAYPCDSWKNFKDNHCSNNKTLMGYYENISDFGNFYLDADLSTVE